MTPLELNKYSELMIAMCTDFILGNISAETFRSNFAMINEKLNPQQAAEIRISTLLDAALDLERGAVLTPKSIKLAWIGRLRGKAAKIRDEINKQQ